MTTSPPAVAAGPDIPAAHAAIAAADAVLRERRALYQFAIDLMSACAPELLGPDLLDSPIARNRIGEALAGGPIPARSDLVGIGDVAGDPDRAAVGLPVASRPEANDLLAAALEAVGTELGHQQGMSGPLRLITEADGERFASAHAMLRDGVALARSVSRDLVDDLLAHVALIAILDPQRVGRLASASSRRFPGLVLLESPRSSIEVAEALVHEGAHQKLFDLAITRNLLDFDSDRCSPFRPPWAAEGRLWPLEQTLAAGHAYACLARFAHESGVTAGRRPVAGGSLLPVASERCEIIGQWLLERGDYLGTDAHTLLERLLGQRPRTATTEDPHTGIVFDYAASAPLEFRRCDSPDRVLVGRLSSLPQLYWVNEDAALLLELLLGHTPLDEIVDTFAHRWSVTLPGTTYRLSTLLSDLSASGLVTTDCAADVS